jgi:hypothetical protein
MQYTHIPHATILIYTRSRDRADQVPSESERLQFKLARAARSLHHLFQVLDSQSTKLSIMFKRGLSSFPLRAIRRTASTLSSSRAQLLQKKDDDVVITFAKRTAMGRAKKGQLKDVPVDELLYALFKVLVVILLSRAYLC